MPVPFFNRRMFVNHFLTPAFVVALAEGVALVAIGQTTGRSHEEKGDQEPSTRASRLPSVIIRNGSREGRIDWTIW